MAQANTSVAIGGSLRTTWVSGGLAHILQHAGIDEPAGTWTGRACAARGLPAGSDISTARLRDLCTGQVADLTWHAPPELIMVHNRAFDLAVRAWHADETGRAQEHWNQLQALWSRAFAASCQALELLQDSGLEAFAAYRPQHWVIASFEHHCSPHGIAGPHIHNIVIPALTTTSPERSGLSGS